MFKKKVTEDIKSFYLRIISIVYYIPIIDQSSITIYIFLIAQKGVV